jgi:hypothetical protein
MQNNLTESVVLRAATEVCRRHSGASLDLALSEKVLPDDWGRSLVWRCRVEHAQTGFPETVIVKTSRLGRGHIFNEWASLQFLNQFDELRSLVPAFYGGDQDLELLVLEDLGQVRGRTDLGTILEGNDPVLAREALLAHARAMAHLHTATRGYEQEFNRLRDQLPPYQELAAKDQFDEHFAWLVRFLPQLGLPAPAALSQEAEAITARLRDPKAPRAYTRGDVCPSNVAYSDRRMRFYDFEMGAYRHVLLSVVYFRMSHLACHNGSLIPLPLQAEAEAAYLEAAEGLISGAVAYADQSGAAAAALLAWMLHTTLEKALQKDRPRHLATYRQRIFAALTQFIQHPPYRSAYPYTTASLVGLLQELDARWSQAEKEIAVFPAFR